MAGDKECEHAEVIYVVFPSLNTKCEHSGGKHEQHQEDATISVRP